MPAVSRPKKIDVLMEQASQALVMTQYFEAERLAVQALELARAADEFGRMARIVLPLQEARRLRVQAALATDAVEILDAPIEEDMQIEPGCYLVQPPFVGADARRLRLAALASSVPVTVVCREPRTQLRLCPIVAIAPGVTVRTKIDPPDDPEHPDLAWFVGAMEAIGDWAIESLDPGLTTLKRLDALLGRLQAVPDHEKLHQALETCCQEAAREHANDAK